ncbi:glycosyltransferase family 2 protein [Cuneatibacter caecimuris]|uniref:Glycosyl transferase family 2 n=1 Tax=Cuneatibacter caecimuris TaxID=1796618 RepID=A0A4Q7NYM8_9FIRM|nr:glycosyltransferase family 2 protein [Cuneatibacter caecimuris]RZS92384.1 glycosyl transferase family 2 [Cuneatibacter caecimuris]
MSKKSNVLIIIPAYNEEENIVRVVRGLEETCPDYDYVVVNDGSSDHTAQLCRENGFSLLDLPVNLGLTGAIQAGFLYAYQQGYDAALQFDADGQHLAQYVDSLVQELDKGLDVVIGSRFVTQKKNKSLRMLGSSIISACIFLVSRVRIKDPTSGMRVFSRATIEKFVHNFNFGPEPDTISYLIKTGARVSEVQVEMAERIAGESYLNPWKSMGYMLRMAISIIFIQAFRK